MGRFQCLTVLHCTVHEARINVETGSLWCNVLFVLNMFTNQSEMNEFQSLQNCGQSVGGSVSVLHNPGY